MFLMKHMIDQYCCAFRFEADWHGRTCFLPAPPPARAFEKFPCLLRRVKEIRILSYRPLFFEVLSSVAAKPATKRG